MATIRSGNLCNVYYIITFLSTTSFKYNTSALNAVYQIQSVSPLQHIVMNRLGTRYMFKYILGNQ